MPGWHDTLKALRDKQEIVLIGVTQEQHAERCRLFAQWQQFDWPILHDPINLLQLRVVPVAVFIDEHGIVRDTKPDRVTIKTLAERTYDAPPETPAAMKRTPPDIRLLQEAAQQTNSFDAWRALGDALILWGGRQSLDSAVAAYQSASRQQPNDAAAHFRLGVAFRMRYESGLRDEADFAQAVKAWGKALDLDPNQYIYRRRIQQYGPRLTKPYPFYDWVDRAANEIKARGETPIPLKVAPSGAEIAQPARSMIPVRTPDTSPDPKGRIQRDEDHLIGVHAVVVPARIRPGGTARVHLSFVPKRNSHWNNEADPLTVWIESAPDWIISNRMLKSDQPATAVSHESRNIEFEVRAPREADGVAKLSGFALYYVCEDVGGTCLFLRQDFRIDLTFKE